MFARSQFDRQSAIAVAREFLKRYAADHEIISVVLGVDQSEILSCFFSSYPPPLDSGRIESLDAHVEELRKVGPPKGPIARILSINGNALFSYREGSTVYEEVLSGTDPTRLGVEGAQFHLLHLSFSKASPAVTESSRYQITLYFRAAPRISISKTVAATRTMLSRLRTKNLTILVRSDGWFFERNDYPAYPAFIRDLNLPDANKYRLSSYTSCGSQHGEDLSCSGRNFEP